MRWDADPVLVDFGLLAIRWYGVFFATGVFVALCAFSRLFRRRGWSKQDAASLSLWLLVGMVLGAHLLHLAFYEPWSFVDDPIRIIQLGYGLASHGGALGAILALWLWCRRRKAAFCAHADVLALASVWVLPFIRTGNFFNSEIVGRPTDLPWGIVFAQRGLAQARHPAQLYEALVGLVLIGLAIRLDRNRERLRPGYAFYLVLLLYFGARFLVEFVKEYQVLSESFPLTMGHMLSLPVVVVALLGLRWTAQSS